MDNYKEKGKCCICKERYYHFGNNALPLKDGRCCDKCNLKVLQVRLQNHGVKMSLIELMKMEKEGRRQLSIARTKKLLKVKKVVRGKIK